MAWPCLPSLVVEAKLGALGLHQTHRACEARDAELLGGSLARVLVFDERQLREPLDLGVGIIVTVAVVDGFLFCAGWRLILGRVLDQRRELLAGVAGGEPVANVCALWDARANASRDPAAARAWRRRAMRLAGRIGVRVAGCIVVVEHDDVGHRADCSLCALVHFGRLPSSLAPCALQVAMMPSARRLSASFSPSTTATIAPFGDGHEQRRAA